jgi:hypothetical protein
MKKIFIAIIFAFLFMHMDSVKAQQNTCLIDASILKKRMDDAGIASNIITFKYIYNGYMIGHAIVAYKVSDTWFAWDSKHGSIPIIKNKSKKVNIDYFCAEFLKKIKRKKAYLMYSSNN